MEKQEKSSKNLEHFLNYVREMIVNYNYHNGALNVEDKRSQDLLHELELGPSKNKDRVATKLRKSRKERRVHKDFIEINTSIYDFFVSSEGKAVMHRLEEILGCIRKQEKYTQNRIYIPRIKDDTDI